MIDEVSGELLAVGGMLLAAAEAAVRHVAADDNDAQVVASLLRQACVIMSSGEPGTLDIWAATPRQRQMFAALLLDPMLVQPATRYVKGAAQLADVFADIAAQISRPNEGVAK